MNINTVGFSGRLTRDPETRAVGETSVTDLSIASNRRYKSKAGEPVEETTFVDVSLWGKIGEVAQKYLKKGSLAYVQGRLTQDSWEDKETGAKRSKIKITGEKLELGPKEGDSSGSGSAASGGNADADAGSDGDDGGPLF